MQGARASLPSHARLPCLGPRAIAMAVAAVPGWRTLILLIAECILR